MRALRAQSLILGTLLLSCQASWGDATCDGVNDICVVRIGGVHRADCETTYMNPAKSMINAINALNGGKGFGIKAGAAADQFFFKLNYTTDSYPEGEHDSVGEPKAMNLFPKLDMVVGMGDKCSGGDPETLKFAKVANDLQKMYFTTRGPSRILTDAPFKPYFFSIHLNSDEYPATALQQFGLRGMKTASVIWESSGNFFFEGVGARATELVVSNKMSLLVKEQVQRVPTEDWGHLNRSIAYAIGNRTDVIVMSMATPMFKHAMDLIREAQDVHTFKAVWAVNIPWGNSCGGIGKECSHAIGATQISVEEIAVYRDGLVDMTYEELLASEHFLPVPNFQGTQFWDISSIISVFVQSIQNFYRFRSFDTTSSIFNNAALYNELRSYMREGSLLGNTMAGPTTFTSSGANGGRSPSTMQLNAEGSAAPLVFPALYAQAGFVFPSPASIPCVLNFYRNYSNTSCALCAHECVACFPGTQWIEDEVCGCSPGFYSRDGVREVACDSCFDGAECPGDMAPPFPKAEYWANKDKPYEFHECRTARCTGGPEHTCEPGFSGIMCEATATDYSSFGAGIRMKCPDNSGMQALMHVGLILGVLLLFFVMNNLLAKWFDSVDLFFDSMQRIAIVSNFRLRWHESFYKGFPLFALLEVVLLDADLARPECVMPWNFGYSFWTQKLLLIAFLFLIWVPVGVKCWMWKRRFKLTWSETLYDREFGKAIIVNEACSGTIDILTMMYPTLAKNTMDSFFCREINGKNYLVADPNYECGTQAHIIIMAMSALLQPTIILGIPIFFTYILWKGNRDQTLHHRSNLERFGVMYERYEPPYLWWENWRVIQMLILVTIQVTLWEHPLLQADLALLLFMAGLASHYYAQPYASGVLDRMDSFAYLFSCLWTLFGINFYSSSFVWNEELYIMAMVCITVYALATCVMAYVDVKERVDSRLAATKLFETAKALLQQTKIAGSSQKDDVAHFLAAGSHHEFDSADTQGEVPETKKQARRLARRKSEEEMVQLHEIQQTLNGAYLRQWARKGEVNLRTYGLLRQLDEWLEDVVSDQSVTSQFSLLPEAAFYRSVEKAFPTMLGWIRKAEPDEVRMMAESLTSILQQSHEPQREYSELIVERDRSSVIYWLLQVSNDEQRTHFFEAMDMLLASVEIPETEQRHGNQNNLARHILQLAGGSSRRIVDDVVDGNDSPAAARAQADTQQEERAATVPTRSVATIENTTVEVYNQGVGDGNGTEHDAISKAHES